MTTPRKTAAKKAPGARRPPRVTPAQGPKREDWEYGDRPVIIQVERQDDGTFAVGWQGVPLNRRQVFDTHAEAVEEVDVIGPLAEAAFVASDAIEAWMAPVPGPDAPPTPNRKARRSVKKLAAVPD